MREMTFRTVGFLPVTATRWFIREGGGHVWFVNEDHDIPAMALVDGVLVVAVDAATDVDVPLIQPKVDA